LDWNIIAGASSALGALGVILTVVYLAVQISLNTKSVEGATEQSLMALEVEVYALIAEYSDEFVRGSANLKSLNPADTMRFQMMVSAEMSLVYSAYVQWQRNLVTEDVWNAYRRGLQASDIEHGYLEMWHRIEIGYPTAFRQALLLEDEVVDA
jgi:hypothetical protein